MSIRHRVLAVDDHPRNLAIVEKSLAGAYELVTCGTGDEALEVAPRFRPDVVLLDIMMPGIDGYETCRRLRTLRAVTGCKIIMVSAKASAADRLEGYAAGADDFITKPFDFEELQAKLRVYVRLKSVEEVDRLKSDLLLLLGHETRTPLSSVLMPADLLLHDASLTPAQRQMVEVIQRGGERLLSLIEHVSYLSELKSGKLPVERVEWSASELLAEATRMAITLPQEAPLDAARVQFHEAASGAPLQVSADRGQIVRALSALLHNALRLSPSHTPVKVSVSATGPWCEIAVHDEGPGIGPEFIDRVFDEFTVENLKHHGRGHGLSLATARLICEQHGGDLTVASTLAAGSTFTVRIPLLQSEERAA